MKFSEKSDQTLITYVIAYRLFGLNKKNATMAMQELMVRRLNNSSFNFELEIENQIKLIPIQEFDLKKPLNIINFFKNE